MKWRDMINAISRGYPEFMDSECDAMDMVKLSLKYMTQDELWSHHDDGDYRIRYIVAQKIKDQDRLWEMRNDQAYNVGGMVARRIKDKERLIQLAAVDNSSMAFGAAKRIKDPDDLVRVAAVSKYDTPIEEAIKRLAGDTDRLRKIVSLTKNPKAKVYAAVALHDQELLWSLRDDLDYNSVDAFVEHIEGDDRILEFITTVKDRYNTTNQVPSLLASRIENQDKLWELYKGGAVHLMAAVAEVMRDEDKLWSMQFDPLSEHDTIRVKRIIASRITSVERLAALVDDEDEGVRLFATNQMDEVMRGHKEDIV